MAVGICEYEQRLAEIDAHLLSLPPKATHAHGLAHIQRVKWSLYCERRALRLKLAKSRGTHTDAEWRRMLIEVNFSCAICGSKNRPSKDHIVAVAAGGSDAITNIRVLCVSCNSRKGARSA